MKTKKQQRIKQQILNTIPIFLAKTYKIVDNPQYKDIISWTQDGNGFIVKDINKLTTQIFPKHFKHSNFASFVRQLNMYGFHKIKSEEQGHAFTHQFFQKNQVQKLQDIKRKNVNTSNDLQHPNQSNMMVPLRRQYQTQVQKQLNIIRNKHEDLQGFVSMLVDQNKQILMQNRNFVNKMSKMQQKYRNKLQTLMLLLLFGKAKNSNGQPFILPQQFQNMLQSFSEANSGNINGNNNSNSFSFAEDNLMKKRKSSSSKCNDAPLKMIRNESEAQIQKKNNIFGSKISPIKQQQKHDDIDYFLVGNDFSEQKKQAVPQPANFRDQLDDSLGLIPPSPNHSYVSFPQFYEKQDNNNEISEFLDKLRDSDYEDLGVGQQKRKL